MTTSEQTWPSTDRNGIALVDPVGLTLAGTVVLLARKAATAVDSLYYNVRVSGADPGVPQEWAGWNELRLTGKPAGSADDRPLLRIAGMDLITVDSAAAAPKPADAPFRAVPAEHPSPADIGNGVANVLAPLDGHTASKLGDLVPWWAAFLAATGRKPGAAGTSFRRHGLRRNRTRQLTAQWP